MLYLWVKAIHIISIVCWFAGLLYLPRLFVYHALSDDEKSQHYFKTMEKKLCWMIAIPSMVLVLITGFWIIYMIPFFFKQGWFHVKLLLVLCLVGYQLYCVRLISNLRNDINKKSHVWYRVFNEIPAVILIITVILVVIKPF